MIIEALTVSELKGGEIIDQEFFEISGRYPYRVLLAPESFRIDLGRRRQKQLIQPQILRNFT